MTTTDMQAILRDAMRVIAESADELRAGCAMEINGEHEWPDAEDKAEYDRRVAVLESVRALASRPDARADERGAFEAWAIREFGFDRCELVRQEDGYAVTGIDNAWDGWQARAAAPQAEAAQGVTVAINLEGLRARLLAPRMIVRDEDGWLTHPDFPICDEDVRADKFLEALRIEAAFVSMEDDVSHEAYEEYHESRAPDCSSWTPTMPSGNGWQLLEIYDTEDGPYALFGRDAYTAEQERRKEHTRKLRAAVDAARPERSAALSPDREQVGEARNACLVQEKCAWPVCRRECVIRQDASPSRECGERQGYGKEWCMRMAEIEPEDGVPPAGLAASAPTLGDSDPCPFCPSGSVCKTPKCGRLAQNSAPAVAQPLTEEQREAIEWAEAMCSWQNDAPIAKRHGDALRALLSRGE